MPLVGRSVFRPALAKTIAPRQDMLHSPSTLKSLQDGWSPTNTVMLRNPDTNANQELLRIGSKEKLRPKHRPLLLGANLPPLLESVADVVCGLGVLPRKELFEAWEVAIRVDDAFPRSTRVADLAAGHGLLAWLLLLLASSRGQPRSAVCVDVQMPASADMLSHAFCARWPHLGTQMHYVEGPLEAVIAQPHALLTSIHACGALSDGVMQIALDSGCSLAMMPCCHSLRKQPLPPLRGLAPSAMRDAAKLLGQPTVIDALRVAAMRAHGYRVWQRRIPREITLYNKLIFAQPRAEVSNRVACTDDAAASCSSSSVATCSPQQAFGSSDLNNGVFRVFTKAGRQELSCIPVCEVGEIAALAGRKASLWERWIELSFWIDEVQSSCAGADSRDAHVIALECLAESAVAAVESDGKGKERGVAGAGQQWDAAAAVSRVSTKLSRARHVHGDRDAERPTVAECTQSAAQRASLPTIDVLRREEYISPTDGRRAHSYRVTFRREGREISRQDARTWQKRIREAVLLLNEQTKAFILR